MLIVPCALLVALLAPPVTVTAPASSAPASEAPASEAPACPPGRLLLGVRADGSPRCGSWARLQADSRKGAPLLRLPPGAVKRVGATYRIQRPALQTLLSQGLQRLAGQARAEPEYAGGERVGFRLSRIRAGSLFASLGLRDGDLLIDVNGRDLGNPVQVMGLYGLLFAPDARATLRLRRGATPLRLVWQIDG